MSVLFSCNHSFYGFHSFGICCCAGSLWLLGVRWRSTWHLCYMPDWVVVHPPWEQWICELYKTHILCLGFHSSQVGWLIPGFNNILAGYQSEGAWSLCFCCGANISLTCLICLLSTNNWRCNLSRKKLHMDSFRKGTEKLPVYIVISLIAKQKGDIISYNIRVINWLKQLTSTH